MCCTPKNMLFPILVKLRNAYLYKKNIGTWGWPTEISCVIALCKCKKGKFSMNSANSFCQIMGFGLCDFTDS